MPLTCHFTTMQNVWPSLAPTVTNGVTQMTLMVSKNYRKY